MRPSRFPHARGRLADMDRYSITSRKVAGAPEYRLDIRDW
jgi:hypothetical protein